MKRGLVIGNLGAILLFMYILLFPLRSALFSQPIECYYSKCDGWQYCMYNCVGGCGYATLMSAMCIRYGVDGVCESDWLICCWNFIYEWWECQEPNSWNCG